MAAKTEQEIEKGTGIITSSGARGVGVDLTLGITRFGIGLASRITDDPKDTIRLLDLHGTAFVNVSAAAGSAWVEGKGIGSARLGAAGVVGLQAEGGITRADVAGFSLGAKARLGIDFMGAQYGDKFQLAWLRAQADAGFSIAGGTARLIGGEKVLMQAPGRSSLAAEGAIDRATLSGFSAGANVSASFEAGLAKIKGVKIAYAELEATAEIGFAYGSGSVTGQLRSATIHVPGGTFVEATA